MSNEQEYTNEGEPQVGGLTASLKFIAVVIGCLVIGLCLLLFFRSWPQLFSTPEPANTPEPQPETSANVHPQAAEQERHLNTLEERANPRGLTPEERQAKLEALGSQSNEATP